MRVLVGAALVVGSMADGHCASADCDACADAFTECGGYTDSAGLSTAYTAWKAIAEADRTDEQTNCINKADNIMWAARDTVAAACVAMGGTHADAEVTPVAAWTPVFVAAGDNSCDNVTGVWAAGDGNDACIALLSQEAIAATWADAVGTCTVDGVAGSAGTNLADCAVGTDGGGIVTSWGSETSAASCTGANANAGNVADAPTCESANVPDVQAVMTTGAAAACNNDAGGIGGTAGDAVAAGVNAGWTDLGSCQTEVAEVVAVAAGCTGGSDGTAGTWGAADTTCDVTKASACILHHEPTDANADCWAEPDAASSSADGSDISPASMLQVGAAVLASLAMLL